MQNQKIMLIEETDSDQPLALTPARSFRPPDMVVVEIATSAGQPCVTNHVPTQVVTNPTINATDHSIMNTTPNQGAISCPIHHE